MALYTKKLIMATFQTMLEELPFDKITVTALVKQAGISPNTFSYHSQSICLTAFPVIIWSARSFLGRMTLLRKWYSKQQRDTRFQRIACAALHPSAAMPTSALSYNF